MQRALWVKVPERREVQKEVRLDAVGEEME